MSSSISFTYIYYSSHLYYILNQRPATQTFFKKQIIPDTSFEAPGVIFVQIRYFEVQTMIESNPADFSFFCTTSAFSLSAYAPTCTR